MSLVLEAHGSHGKAAGRSAHTADLRHRSFTVIAMTMMFLGLVVLPQTHKIATPGSIAGATDFLVGP